MSFLIDDKDIQKVSAAASQVISGAIANAAEVLVPAVARALGGAAGDITITIGPIAIEPIKVEISIGASK